MRHPAQLPVWSSLATVLVIGLALLINLGLSPWIGVNVYPLFLLAVLVGAWFGGMTQGLMATIVSCLVILAFFRHPGGSPGFDSALALRVSLFLLAAIPVCLLVVAFRRADEARRVSERDYRLMVENVCDYAIFLLDLEGQVSTWNEGAERLLGYRDEEILGQHFAVLFPPEAIEAGGPQWEMETASRVGRADDERWHVRKDGSRFWASGVLTAVWDERAQLRGFVKVMRDITLRKEAEDERKELLAREQRARAESEAASRVKDRFLAALSHELRTPLTPVLMTVSALEDDPAIPENHRGDLAMIRRNVELEARLIDDLLDLTRVAEGKLKLENSLVNVHDLIRHAIGICRRELEAKGLEFAFRPVAERYCVRGDPARLQQVLWNLLKNAVKFTPPCGRITVTTADAEGSRLRVEVVDTGIGIPADMLPRIFDAFEQGDPAITHRFGGLGLGLAISKALVEAHGGLLTAASEGQDWGSTFSLLLGDAEAPTDEACVSPDLESRPVGGHLRILLVEDHEDTRAILGRTLERSGHDVTTAGTVASAIEAAATGPFDLLISDVGLPDGSGVDLMRRLQPLPGIALTGFGMATDIARCREAGFRAHLTKPIDPTELGKAIQLVAGHNKMS